MEIGITSLRNDQYLEGKVKLKPIIWRLVIKNIVLGESWTGDCVSDTKDRLLETEENVGSSNKIGKYLFILY